MYNIPYVSTSLAVRNSIIFCTYIYSPTKLASISTTINVPYFFASLVMFVLYFLKGDNASRYIATPAIIDAFYNRHFSTHPPTIIICYKLQHIFHFTHQLPTHAKASFRNSLPPNYILTPIRSYVHITPFFRIS